MGLLEQVIGGVVGQVFGGGRGQQGGGAMSPIVKALLMLLLAKGASGGLGDIFGGGRQQTGGPAPREPEEDGPSPFDRGPPSHGDDGDLGGFGQRRGGSTGREGDFSDLSGMLDGPGDRAPGAGPYARLDHDGAQGHGGEGREAGPGGYGGGLDELIQNFERSGLGDVIGSWIGSGQNRSIEPNRLADALGPDTVETLSRQSGLGRNELLDQLAQALPSVIDGLTPHGRRPSEQDRQGW